jgi:hypothetical protein
MTLMLARRGRVVFRHLTFTESHFPASRAPFSHDNAQLVAIFTNKASHVLSNFSLPNGSLPIILKNSYASSVGRPKAHTGRAAASKKPASRKPKAKAEATAKKKNAKKSKAGKTGKSKRETKLKPKAKSKSKRLTEKQKEALKKKKEREEIKALKEAALTPPKRLPTSAYAVFNKEKHTFGAASLETYRNLPTAEREVRVLNLHFPHCVR